jgi:hypothetical protein
MTTKETLLNVILLNAAQAGRIPERSDIEAQIDGLVAGFPHLRDAREWLLSKLLEVLVTQVRAADELVDPNQYVPWIEAADRTHWSSWPWMKLYLRHHLHRPVSVIDELDRSTDRILDLLGDPLRPGLWDRRGLVVGHVQSGKTQHYTALAAKAIDAGFKVVIILSGIHENLRQQTQERVEESITGKNSRKDFEPFGIRDFQASYKLLDAPKRQMPDGSLAVLRLPDISSLTSIAGDYGAAINRIVDVPIGAHPIVFVAKKNVFILRNLLRKLRGPDNGMQVQRSPVLVIDDEADHSSVNVAREDEDPKRINEQIRKLLWCCDRVAFVGYTATPYANIFMDDVWIEKTEAREIDAYGSDLFPRAFIIGLTAPSNYVGPEAVFGHEGDDSVGIPAVAPLPMQVVVNDADAWLPPRHKNGHAVTADLPASLLKALNCFVLAIASRMTLGQDTSHCSMLVHVTRFNSVQAQVMEHIRAHLEALRNRLSSGADRAELWAQLESLWNEEYVAKFDAFRSHPSQIHDPPQLPAWSAVRACALDAFGRLTFALVNSLSKEGLDFASNATNGLVVLAVGGDRLSRGLTLEGLVVSYFLRGAQAYDTLMQMGRWFGYRPGYAHLCRVFAPQSIIGNFRTIVLATEELRREFARMAFLHKTPTEYGLRVREPRGDLLVTALNRMRRGQTVRIHFAESLISGLEYRDEDLPQNYEAFQRLIADMNQARGQPRRVDANGASDPAGSTRIWDGVPVDCVLRFLGGYSAVNNACLDRATSTGKCLLQAYLETVHSHGDLDRWTVAVIGSQRGDRLVEGMDNAFRPVSRSRLMLEGNRCEEPIVAGRVSFKAVAMGQDEAIDLTLAQRESVDRQYLSDPSRLSRAELYRSHRPSTRGLLLLYPIVPTTPVAAKKHGKQSDYLWNGKAPLIGVAVSLPDSQHDMGCDYVCTRQKMRELFGELADDLERDDDEASNPAAAAT